MTWTLFDTWIIVAGVLCAVACALPGTILVLRRMSMMGDAISHAVLPGLALAFLFTGSRASLPMFAGAAASGVLAALAIQWINRLGKVDQGASMGIVFTTLFAIGLLLIVQAADHVDLDPGCVLYGAIELVPLDIMPLGGMEVPRSVVVLLAVLLVNLTLLLVFYKEFRITAFDPGLASTAGISPAALHYLLMIMVAVTTVASFEAVGSILVIAMLVVPAATASLLTQRFGSMLMAATALAAVSAILGHLGALVIPPWFGFRGTSTSGMMAVAAGALFLAAWLFNPDRGLLTRRRASRYDHLPIDRNPNSL